MLRRFLCTWTNWVEGGVLAVVASMKPIVGLDFSSSTLKSCHFSPSLFSSVIESMVRRRTTTRQFSVWTVGWAAGPLTDAQQSMASLLCFFFLFLSCCCVMFFAHPGPSTSAFCILHAVFSTLSRLRMTWEQHRRLLGTEPFALTDWLTDWRIQCSVLLFFHVMQLTGCFFFLRNFHGGFVPCLRLVMMMMMIMMWFSCHWIQCSSVWPWLRPNLSSSDPQKYTEKTQNLMLLNCLQLYVWSTSCVCLFRRWQYFVFLDFCCFFGALVDWRWRRCFMPLWAGTAGV